MISLPIDIYLLGHPSTLLSGRALFIERMRHHLAHQVWQRLASKVGKRHPARIFWGAHAYRYLRNVDDQIEWKMREHVRHHAGNAAPARARELRRFVEGLCIVEFMGPGGGRHLGHPTEQSFRRARTHKHESVRAQYHKRSPAPTPPFRLRRLNWKVFRIATHAGYTGVIPWTERTSGPFRRADRGAEIHQSLRKIPAAALRGEPLRELLDVGFCHGQCLVDGTKPRDHALDIAIDRHHTRIERDGRDRRRSVAADARERAQLGLARWKLPAMALNNSLCAGMQVAGTGVVAEPGPGPQHIIERRRRERFDIRPARREAQKVR